MFFGCEKKVESNKQVVVVDLYPIEFLAKKIAGDKIEIFNVVGYGVEPHDFELSMNSRKIIESSRGFIKIGGGIDSWSDKIEHKNVLDLSKSVNLIKIKDRIDPHYWSDFENLQKMSGEIANFLSKQDPSNREFYMKNSEILKIELSKIDNEYKNSLKDCKHNKLVVTHEAYNYLTKRYSIDTVSILGIEPDEEPSLMKLKEIKTVMSKDNLNVIFLEKIVSSKIPSVIAKETGAKVKPLYSLENLDNDDIKNGKDLLSMSRENLFNIKEALECK